MRLKATAFAIMILPVAAAAQPVIGPYVSLGAGVNLQQNEIVTPTKLPAGDFPTDVIYAFHPGFAGRVASGYGIGHALRLEIEGDYIDNVVRGAREDLLNGTNPPRRGGGVEQKYGGFVNALYDVELGLPVHPFIGIGAGGLEVQHNGFNQGPFTPPPVAGAVNGVPPGTRLGFHQQGVGGFAYQGIAGFSVPLPWVAGLSLTAEYHFIGLLDPLPAFQLETTRIIEVFNQPTSGPISLPIAFPKRIAVSENRHFTNDYNHEIVLGVRYALFQPPAPPPPVVTPGAIAAPPPAPIPVARSYLVFFDWDRADLTARARQIVAQAASAVQSGGIARIEVNGYTDLSGTPAYNQRLSVRRAVSVKAELVRDGVPAAEIDTVGRGETNPLVPTAQGVREPQNRRVEIVLR